ncbi:uncharacterized protein LOC131679387 [Topomyia yanbarensis]|uniref:uncharacterized protein LOC131679387 n=1 Tax=Topomyia yanbarensis TaxID=2498891 RepID=UPI00273C9D5B|nr:uncharacterized protein LOC131679387 [Topomyia yanbarensis]
MVSDTNNLVSKDRMLYDQGSSGYKDWLSKSSTLDDIYRNYLSPSLSANSSDHQPQSHRANASPTSNPRTSEDEYFDEGVITGYAVQQPDPQPGYHSSYNHYRNPYQYPSQQPPIYGPQPAASKNFHQHELLQGEASYDSARGDYSYHPAIEFEEKSVSKGLGLKDLFDIALTTLAFLSFGMFILQVIMCITMTKTDANMMMIPVDGGGGELEGGTEEEVRRRTARSLPMSDGARLGEINAIARKVLDSMDAAVFAMQDEGQCAQKTICEGNRFSRELKFTRRYWMAVWNLGVSWLTGNMVEEEARPGTILGCLRAMMIGLGGGDCDKSYNCSKEQARQRGT